MQVVIRKDSAPALGDLRRMGTGDHIILVAGVTDRKDWARVAHALVVAVAHGASVGWLCDGSL